MASLDPSIILRAGQTADIMGAVGQGNALAQQTIQMQQQGAQNAFLRDNAQGLLAGEQNALAGLAQFDPSLALNIQTQNRNNARADEQMAWQRERAGVQDQQTARQNDRADQEWAWKVEQHRVTVGEAEAAAQAQQIEDAVKMGLAIQTPEQWDAMMAKESPELVGMFDQRQVLAQRYMDMADILKGQRGPQPLSRPGKVQADIDAGLLPLGTPLQGAGVTVNTGSNSDKFTEESDKAAAGRFNDYVASGSSATAMTGDLKALADLGSQIQTGKGAQVMVALGPYAEALGVKIDGLGPGQAYQSVVDRLAPAMRPAGSGASSDFDARQFLRSLPGLGNTPEGNQIIIETLSALQEHKIAAAEIASSALDGRTTWQEAERKIRALGNPYDAFNRFAGASQPSAGTAPTPSDRQIPDSNQQDTSNQIQAITDDAGFDALPSGAMFKGPDGVTRRKP